jgi:simple sugar transport system ATP-binding protein
MISQDLEEVFAVSHRIAVLYDGAISAPMIAADVTPETVGLLMGGSEPQAEMSGMSGMSGMSPGPATGPASGVRA